jgi:spermidine synthase
MKRYLIVLAVFCIMTTLSAEHVTVAHGPGKILECKMSPYAPVKVVEEGGVRSLYLGPMLQSAWDPAYPDAMAFVYTKAVGTAITAWHGAGKGLPARALVVGLGGGAICRHMLKYYPRFRVEAVELDPVVYEFALKYSASASACASISATGARFSPETAPGMTSSSSTRSERVISPLSSPPGSFFELAKSRLSPGGLVIANTHMEVGSDEHERRTFHAVFGGYYEIANPEKSGNRIIVCGRDGMPEEAALRKHMESAASSLRVREFEVADFIEDLRRVTDPPRGEIITDANARLLLNKR